MVLYFKIQGTAVLKYQSTSIDSTGLFGHQRCINEGDSGLRLYYNIQYVEYVNFELFWIIKFWIIKKKHHCTY